MLYYNQKEKGDTDMATSMEMMEIWGDAIDEIREWADFEADMATDPYGQLVDDATFEADMTALEAEMLAAAG